LCASALMTKAAIDIYGGILAVDSGCAIILHFYHIKNQYRPYQVSSRSSMRQAFVLPELLWSKGGECRG
jgi:hypothetical protein